MKNKYVYMFFSLFIVFLFCLGSYQYYYGKVEKKEYVQKVDHGKAYKIYYSGHSYVVWQQNLSDCIIHDPDCLCHK